ncbi:D-alanyl-D-alanine carboxypeptidase family protein [Pseudalkalibacillus caeni]|uniref:D-alanyl-D-alanine carboxypeptidase family protein n=2 Tax=Exobacillus caeni TaxID=2574798 RepID=A0A5R9FAQ0_9BACL|nr:D-alanyl-D-alanine carboxypeptidase family protein [Pseudalkalibacillus caeni]
MPNNNNKQQQEGQPANQEQNNSNSSGETNTNKDTDKQQQDNHTGEEPGNNDSEDKSDENSSDKNQQGSEYPGLEETVKMIEGKKVVTNPASIYVVANKQRNLPADYTPSDLVEPDVPFPFAEDLPKKLMRKEAASALEELFKAAQSEGLDLVAQSGYRSYERQDAIFAYNVQQRGEEKANQVSARPGQSEHQTGLTMDVTTPTINYALTEQFAETPEGKWVKENSYKYGFVIRYPKGKEEITGYQYEPWHLRYVGKEAASEIYKKDTTLEEFFSKN